jgi:Bardet-Biedl syndrome 1 protein
VQIVIHDRGSLTIKMLKRNASLEGTATGGTAPEQEIPLKIPKKTKLFVEQAQRERESVRCEASCFQ